MVGWATEAHRSASKSYRLAGGTGQHLSTHFFLFRYGTRLRVRQRDGASQYRPSESATEPLHVSSFSFLNRSFRRSGTNHGIPLVGGSAAEQAERVQKRVCPPSFVFPCGPTADRSHRDP